MVLSSPGRRAVYRSSGPDTADVDDREALCTPNRLIKWRGLSETGGRFEGETKDFLASRGSPDTPGTPA
jgi:hypothetical protein